MHCAVWQQILWTVCKYCFNFGLSLTISYLSASPTWPQNSIKVKTVFLQNFHWTSSRRWVTFRCTRRTRRGSRWSCRDLRRVSAGWKVLRSCRATTNMRWSRKETCTFCRSDRPPTTTRQSTCSRQRTRGQPANSSYKVTSFYKKLFRLNSFRNLQGLIQVKIHSKLTLPK